MSLRRFPPLAVALALLCDAPFAHAEPPAAAPPTVPSSAEQWLTPAAVAAVAWYDTLGYPDAKDLPYVRVATGLTTQEGDQPAENTFMEGFLLRQDDTSFTVFLCSVSDFKKKWESTHRIRR
jgi:hypothetical protein